MVRYRRLDSLLNYRKLPRSFLPIAALNAPLLEFVSNPATSTEKTKTTRMGSFSFWRRRWDSNPRAR